MLSSREIIRMLKADGWTQAGVTGDHHHFKHPAKPGKVTVPHPQKDFTKAMIHSIEKQAGIKLR